MRNLNDALVEVRQDSTVGAGRMASFLPMSRHWHSRYINPIGTWRTQYRHIRLDQE